MTPQNTTWLVKLETSRTQLIKKEQKNLHRFVVFLPLFVGIFMCVAGILTKEVFMLALGAMGLICAVLIDLVMEGVFDF